MTDADAAIRTIDATAYRIPTEVPEGDGTLTWSATTVVIVRVYVADVVGLGWTYAHHACVPVIRDSLVPLVQRRDVRDVAMLWQTMQESIRNNGRRGLVSCAMSAVETAMWDAAARVQDMALSRLLGLARTSVPVYGSGGFTTYEDGQLHDQLQRWMRQQLPAVKIKVGESWGHAVRRDLERVELTRQIIGDDIQLYVDANGGYSVGQAVRVGRAFDGFGVLWFEEPVSSDDLEGLRRVRMDVGADVAAGEYGYELGHFHQMLEAEAVDCLQVDVTRCGGFSEWQRVAALAAARSRQVSGHCAQNLSAHVAAATHNIRHLEWFRDHERIESLFFDGVLEPSGGHVWPDLTAPGHGMRFKEQDAEPYRVM